MSTFSDWADLVHGPDRDWGQLSCGCHPNCGIGMALMIDKETKEAVPVTAFLDAVQLAKDVAKINDAARGKFLSIVGVSLALLRNYDPTKAPTHFKIMDLLQKFDKCFGATGKNYGKVTADRTMADIEKRRADRWNFLFIAGMWFQDLFNYDFRRTEQCIIPYATQEGEISFCAYNTGVGWRNIIEKMHMTSTLTKWYEEHGRHEIFAGGKKVGLEKEAKYDLVLNDAHVNAAANDTFDKSGIAKNAREEKIRARDAKIKQDAENARMAKLYRKEVLKGAGAPRLHLPRRDQGRARTRQGRRDRLRRLITLNSHQQKGRQQWRPYYCTDTSIWRICYLNELFENYGSFFRFFRRHWKRIILRAHKDRRSLAALLLLLGILIYVGIYGYYFLKNPVRLLCWDSRSSLPGGSVNHTKKDDEPLVSFSTYEANHWRPYASCSYDITSAGSGALATDLERVKRELP